MLEIEMEESIAAQRHQLKRLQYQRDLQVMAVKLKAYSETDSGESSDESKIARSEVANCPLAPYKEIKEELACMNNNNEQTNHTNHEASLVQALHDTLAHIRLPAPEPSVFQGTHLSS